jgi:UrcA family protein
MTRNHFAWGIWSFALLTLAPVITAAQQAPPLTYRVSFGDLNLDSNAGIEHLYGRIRSAADSVCHLFVGRDLKSVGLHKQCVDEAIEKTVGQIGLERLTAYYHLQYHGQPPMAVADSSARPMTKTPVTSR